MNTILTINIDYHHTPLGLTAQDISLVHGLGFPIQEIIKYMYRLYLMGLLVQYNDKQDVLNELVVYTPIFGICDYEHELMLLQQYLYTSGLDILAADLAQVTDLNVYATKKSSYDTINTLIKSKGKFIDVLCDVFVKINTYLLSNSQVYINPLNNFMNISRLSADMIAVSEVNICGGWVVVEFAQVM